MNHCKVLLVDELWVVVGSSSLDNRSFGLNDELNLALPDRALAARLREDFERDAALSRSVDLRDWRRRPMSERCWRCSGRWWSGSSRAIGRYRDSLASAVAQDRSP